MTSYDPLRSELSLQTFMEIEGREGDDWTAANAGENKFQFNPLSEVELTSCGLRYTPRYEFSLSVL